MAILHNRMQKEVIKEVMQHFSHRNVIYLESMLKMNCLKKATLIEIYFLSMLQYCAGG